MAITNRIVLLAIAVCLSLSASSHLVAAVTVTNLYSFVYLSGDGYSPAGGLVEGSDGNFYGATLHGGAFSDGVVFRISPTGSYTNLHSFNGSDGAIPSAGLIQGNDGNFYGTTSGGETVFQITPSGSLTTLHVFCSGSDGCIPEAGLLQGGDGNFYGTTEEGGPVELGTVFRISPTGTYTNLYSFTVNDGRFPIAALVEGNDGDYYGTTQQGGLFGYGTTFRISPGGSLTTLHSFSGGPSEGAYPEAELVQATNGAFYGTTYAGGVYGNGTVFQFSPSGVLTTLYSFTALSDGGNPEGGLVQGSDGNFYGTTPGGGIGAGTVFRISPSGSFTNLWSFNGIDGNNSYAALVQGSDGNFYGATRAGGTNGNGNVFKLSVGLCTFSIGQTNAAFDASGGISNVIVTANGTGCVWIAASHANFIAITSGSSGTSNGVVSYTVAVNSNTTARSGTIFIAGRTFTVTQQSGDSVGDGIPDWWRHTYFLGSGMTTGGQSCATCDPDGDGQNNLREFLSGTNPTNSASCLRITNVLRTNNNLLISWMTGIGRTNALQVGAGGGYNTNNFADIFTVTNTVGTSTNYLDIGGATNKPARYYRVRLVP
jgi:uncharacterized repeat protein (TIGR03803 family)